MENDKVIDKAKNDILDKLASMPPERLDKLRDEKQVELHELTKEYAKTKEELITYQYDTQQKLLLGGLSYNKVYQMLRTDQELYLLKKKMIALCAKRRLLEIEMELAKSYYFRNRI